MILEAFSYPPSLSGINDVVAINSVVPEGDDTMTASINPTGCKVSDFSIIPASNGMIQINTLDSVSPVSQQALLKMAFSTAQGIHDAVCTDRTCVNISMPQFDLKFALCLTSDRI